MYAIMRLDNRKLMTPQGRWVTEDKQGIAVWADKELAEYYNRHNTPDRIETVVVGFDR